MIGTSTGPGGDQRIDANPTTERGRTRMSTVTESAPGTMASRVSRSRDASAAMSAAGRAERRVAAEELGAAAADPDGLETGLRRAAASSAHPEGTRLYELLGHTHRTGGRLADSLGELASDFRASLATELTAEGGRRALAAYGPILAFMIPVTLVFLMYPTLAGLSALSATP